MLCYKPRASDVFTFEFAILLSGFTRKDNRLFCLQIYLFRFLRLKQKMDSLLFLKGSYDAFLKDHYFVYLV